MNSVSNKDLRQAAEALRDRSVVDQLGHAKEIVAKVAGDSLYLSKTKPTLWPDADRWRLFEALMEAENVRS